MPWKESLVSPPPAPPVEDLLFEPEALDVAPPGRIVGATASELLIIDEETYELAPSILVPPPLPPPPRGGRPLTSPPRNRHASPRVSHRPLSSPPPSHRPISSPLARPSLSSPPGRPAIHSP
eukprot:Hpha_TRINITY_DN15564_c4_g1::TRINITY_DN15564_c4_g1_i1::g.107880::m.107880